MPTIPIRVINPDKGEFSSTTGFSIRELSAVLQGRDMVQQLHRHEFFYLLALQRGSGEHEIDFSAYPVTDRCIFLMRPGQVHQLLLKAESSGYLVAFDRDFYYPAEQHIGEVFRQATRLNHYPIQNGIERLFSPLHTILREYSERKDNYLDSIKANLNIFFIELLRHSKRNTYPSASPYIQQRLDEFMQLLELNYNSEKQVRQYADRMSLSPYQLNAITKATLNKNCSDLICEHIILEAKRLLLATKRAVNDIAYQLGYEDVSYFIRFFKKHTGLSAVAFRQNFR